MVEATLEECYLLSDFKIKCRADEGLDVRYNGHYAGHWMETW